MEFPNALLDDLVVGSLCTQFQEILDVTEDGKNEKALRVRSCLCPRAQYVLYVA